MNWKLMMKRMKDEASEGFGHELEVEEEDSIEEEDDVLKSANCESPESAKSQITNNPGRLIPCLFSGFM
jgi:hypothetical protein